MGLEQCRYKGVHVRGGGGGGGGEERHHIFKISVRDQSFCITSQWPFSLEHTGCQISRACMLCYMLRFLLTITRQLYEWFEDKLLDHNIVWRQEKKLFQILDQYL